MNDQANNPPDSPSLPSLEDRFKGCLLGLMVGDALGSHFEGQSAEWIMRRYPKPQALVDDPPQPPWYYTDDTQMAIGVAEALLEDREIVEQSLCDAFVANYVPSRGYGRGTRVVLGAMEDGKDHNAVAERLFPGGSYGNGAAMRVAPVGLFFHADLDRVWEQARLSALPTRVHPLGIEGARLLAAAVAVCLRHTQLSRSDFLAELLTRCETTEFRDKLQLAAEVQTQGDLLGLGNGIAAQDSVVTAIACFTLWPDSYEEVIGNAILLGGDTDTIAAMAGAIAGAHLGIDAIPDELLESVEDGEKGRTYVADLAAKLYAAAVRK